MTVIATTSPAPTDAVDAHAAAPMLGVTTFTLKDWRRRGVGPRYVAFGNRVRYRVCDLEDWLAAHTVEPVPRPGKPSRASRARSKATSPPP